jgi:hypothetical protein
MWFIQKSKQIVFSMQLLRKHKTTEKERHKLFMAINS